VRTFAVVTFGCQMNEHDSVRMAEVLRRAGLAETTEPERADVVLVNTCSVRDKAEQKLRSEVGRLVVLKRTRPAMLLAVTGCVAQQEGEKLLARVPELDLVLGPDNIPELPALLAELDAGGPPRARTVHDVDEPHFLSAEAEPGRTGPTAHVTVMKGCNERCSFCIVPHTRGPERYRPSGEIIGEIARLADAGVREVMLLGQTVNSYRDPSAALPPAPGAGELPWSHTHPTTAREDESEFAALVRRIAAEAPSLRRLRYASPHPRHLTMSLIRAHQELDCLVRHVHLPVQSGSDRILRRMIRRYSVAEYRERVAALRGAVPGVTLSTDVIVGFPGESQADFEQTLSLVQEIGFVGLFGFKYSERPFTPAEKLTDDVTEEDKSARLEALFAMSGALRQRHLESLVGTTQEVLAVGPGKNGFTGRTEANEIVHFGCADDPTGELLDLRVVRAFKNSLQGELVDARRAAPLPARVAEAERRTLQVVS
jgi:tRNA-2-methylthio-N6-dimethylallyladenosine synthase